MKLDPNILVNVISLIIEAIIKESTSNSSDTRIARVVHHARFYKALASTMIKGLADVVIADITAGQINHYFAEIAPRTVYRLYGFIPCYSLWTKELALL